MNDTISTDIAVWLWRVLQEKEKAAAGELHLKSLLDVAVEEPQQVWDVGEWQQEQRDLQFTEKHNTSMNKNRTLTHECNIERTCVTWI